MFLWCLCVCVRVQRSVGGTSSRDTRLVFSMSVLLKRGFILSAIIIMFGSAASFLLQGYRNGRKTTVFQ